MKNSALLVVTYFLSKYDAPRDPQGSIGLGYASTKSAFEAVSNILGFPVNTVKTIEILLTKFIQIERVGSMACVHVLKKLQNH